MWCTLYVVWAVRVLYFWYRDPDDAGVDTAAAIRRMKEARTRAVKGAGVKEVKTLAALQQELKVCHDDPHPTYRIEPTPQGFVAVHSSSRALYLESCVAFLLLYWVSI